MSALDKQYSHARTAFYSLIAIASVIQDVPQNVDLVARIDVVNMIQKTASSHFEDDLIAWAVSRVFSYLFSEHKLLSETGTYTLIVELLLSRLQDRSAPVGEENSPNIAKISERSTSLVVEWTCRCIGCLAVNTDARLALGLNGACEALTTALQIYTPKSMYITREGILALSCLCETRGALANIDRLQEVGGQVAVKAIQKYFDDAEVCWCCCKLLISLSIQPAYLVNVSAGDYVISIMQKHYRNSLVTDWGCRALASLAVDDRYRDVLIGEGACDAIVNALRVAVSGESIFSVVVQRISSIQNLVNKLEIAGGNSFLTKSALGASACYSIFSLADRHDDFRHELGAAGACESVVKVLLKFSSESANVASAACQAIVSLCRDSPLNRMAIGDAGGCKCISQVIQGYSADEDVLVHVLASLVALIPDSIYVEVCGVLSNNRGQPINRFGERKIKTNASCMGHLFEDSSLIELPKQVYVRDSDTSSEEILNFEKYDMGRRSNLSKFTTADSCDNVASALQSHQSSTRVAEVGCWAIALLANSGDEELVRLGTVGACESIVSMLQRHLHSPNICQSSCIALARLAVNAGNSGWLGAAGGCNVVVDVIKQHPDNYPVLWVAWAAVASMSCDEGNRSRFQLLSICELAVEGLSRSLSILENYKIRNCTDDEHCATMIQPDHTIDEICVVCEECCHAISSLARDKNIIEKFLALATVDIVVKILLATNISPGLCAMALAVLTSLMGNGSASKDAISTAGTCEAVIMALQRHAVIDGGDAFVSIQGAIVLYTLTHRSPANQALLGSAGGCEMLLNLLRKYGWTELVSVHACRAINSVILENIDNQMRMANAGACSLILGAMKAHFRSAAAVNRAACALFNLTVDNEVCREQCLAGDGCNILETCLGRHLNTESVCVRVALVIKTFAFDIEGQDKLSQTGICKYLVKALNVHDSSQTATPLLLSVIAALALNHKSNQTNFNSNGGCKAIVSICRRNIRNEGVVIEACRAILAIGDDNEECKTKLAGVGAAEVANNILATYSSLSSRKERSRDISPEDDGGIVLLVFYC